MTTKIKFAAIATMLVMMSACSSTGAKKVGLSATDCFSSGGTIESAGDASMCKMKDGSLKPII